MSGDGGPSSHQSTLTEFFSVRRRLPEQHPAKKRKVEIEEAQEIGHDAASASTTTAAVSAAGDCHQGGVYATPETKASESCAENRRGHKRESLGSVDLFAATPTDDGVAKEDRFTLGRGATSARKRLDMGDIPRAAARPSTRRGGRVVRFEKKSSLSPSKTLARAPSKGIVSFQKKSNLSPAKKRPEEDKEESVAVKSPLEVDNASVRKVRRQLDSMPSPEEVKKKLGTAKKLSNLRDTVQKLSYLSPAKKNQAQEENAMQGEIEEEESVDDKEKVEANNEPVRQLRRKLASKPTPEEVKKVLGRVNKLSDLKQRFQKLSKASQPPKLSDDSFSIEILSPTKKGKSPMKASVAAASPVPAAKASPRKQLTFGGEEEDSKPRTVPSGAELPSTLLPLPKSYQKLTKAFKIMDGLVAFRHNRAEAVFVDTVLAGVQNATRKRFTEKELAQIRCVFPGGYSYEWEWADRTNGFGVKKKCYRLRMSPAFGYESGGDSSSKLTPKRLTDRKRIFDATLLSMAKDHQRKVLLQSDPLLKWDDSRVSEWHRDFDVESCPEVEEEALPPKPEVVNPTGSDLLSATGVENNSRLQQALKDQEEREKKRMEEEEKSKNPPPTPAAVAKPDVSIPKKYRCLPPAMLERLMEKEREKKVQQMTGDPEERKEINMLKELAEGAARKAVNCYKSKSPYPERRALPAPGFFKFVSDSHGRKSQKEVEQLVRHLARVEQKRSLDLITVGRAEYVKWVGKEEPNGSAVEARVKGMLEEKLKARGEKPPLLA